MTYADHMKRAGHGLHFPDPLREFADELGEIRRRIAMLEEEVTNKGEACYHDIRDGACLYCDQKFPAGLRLYGRAEITYEPTKGEAIRRAAEQSMSDSCSETPSRENAFSNSSGLHQQNTGDSRTAGTTPPSPTLLPCPFCGSGKVGCFGPGPEGSDYEDECWCECLYCGVEVRDSWDTRDEARAAWNTRAAPAPEEEAEPSDGTDCSHAKVSPYMRTDYVHGTMMTSEAWRCAVCKQEFVASEWVVVEAPSEPKHALGCMCPSCGQQVPAPSEPSAGGELLHSEGGAWVPCRDCAKLIPHAQVRCKSCCTAPPAEPANYKTTDSPNWVDAENLPDLPTAEPEDAKTQDDVCVLSRVDLCECLYVQGPHKAGHGECPEWAAPPAEPGDAEELREKVRRLSVEHSGEPLAARLWELFKESGGGRMVHLAEPTKAKPADEEEFPEEAFEKWFHACRGNDPAEFSIEMGRWGWARRGEDVALAAPLARLMRQERDAAEAARDAALEDADADRDRAVEALNQRDDAQAARDKAVKEGQYLEKQVERARKTMGAEHDNPKDCEGCGCTMVSVDVFADIVVKDRDKARASLASALEERDRIASQTMSYLHLATEHAAALASMTEERDRACQDAETVREVFNNLVAAHTKPEVDGGRDMLATNLLDGLKRAEEVKALTASLASMKAENAELTAQVAETADIEARFGAQHSDLLDALAKVGELQAENFKLDSDLIGARDAATYSNQRDALKAENTKLRTALEEINRVYPNTNVAYMARAGLDHPKGEG